jgi:hypothetical protein
MENFFLGLAVGESFFGTLSLKHLSSAEILFCSYKIHTFIGELREDPINISYLLYIT